MNKISAAFVVLLTGACTTSAIAAQPDSATLQRVYDQAYQQLSAEREPHQCGAKACPAVPSTEVERIFNTAYAQNVGQQPRYEDFLQWKYLSNYPSTIAYDPHFPQTAHRVTTGHAAVRNIPPATHKCKMKPCPKKK